MGPIDLTARLVAQVEIAKRSAYEVDCAGDKVYYVRDVRTPDGVEYEVNIKNDLKSVKCCPYITMHGLPCRHVVPVFFKVGLLRGRNRVNTIKKFWPKWAMAKYYAHMYAKYSVFRPTLHAGPFKGDDADLLAPPEQTHRKRGRPRKERYRHKPKTVKTVQERLPIVYHQQYSEVLEFL